MSKPSDPVRGQSIEDSPVSDAVIPSVRQSDYFKYLPDRILAHLKELGSNRVEFGTNAVDRLQHSLQTATLAHQDGRDEEYVVCALLHDIGDNLSPYNHGEYAATLLWPYISEKHYWMLANHHVFQGYHYFAHLGLDHKQRDKLKSMSTMTTRSNSSKSMTKRPTTRAWTRCPSRTLSPWSGASFGRPNARFTYQDQLKSIAQPVD